MPLRVFDEQHIREDCSQLAGTYDNGLFYGCTFDNLNGLTLKDCDLNASTFITETIREALGFTLSLNCLSFKNVEYSPLLFDLFLCLVAMSRGNDEKRAKLAEVVGKERFEALSRILGCVE